MSRERTLNIAKTVTSQLHITEEAIDSALSEAAGLLDTCISSRRSLRLSTLMTTGVNDSTLKAMMALQTAQAHMADAHSQLANLQHRLGLDDTLLPPVYDKPPTEPGPGVTEARRSPRQEPTDG